MARKERIGEGREGYRRGKRKGRVADEYFALCGNNLGEVTARKQRRRKTGEKEVGEERRIRA